MPPSSITSGATQAPAPPPDTAGTTPPPPGDPSELMGLIAVPDERLGRIVVPQAAPLPER